MKISNRLLAASGLCLVLLLGIALLFQDRSGGQDGGSPVVVTARAADDSVLAQHDPYIQGDDGFFHPDRQVTRAQLAQMLYSLGISRPGDASYADLAADDWYTPAVEEVSALFTGYEDGTFRPNAAAEMGEFVTLLCRAVEQEPSDGAAPGEPWYAPYWQTARENGWFPDELHLQGDSPVTRATAVAMLNRAMGRTPDEAYLDGLTQAVFVDVPPDHWAYAEILEAAVGHQYAGDGSWLPESVQLSPLEEGLYLEDGLGYYVDEDGILCRTPGILTLPDGSSCLVADTAGRIWADNGFHLYGNSLVCCASNGKLLKNNSFQGFFFDGDGLYTSGSAEIDGYVEAILTESTDVSMTRAEKLRAAFDYVRSYGYLGRNATIPDAVMSPEQASAYALKIFETGKGDCYNFTAAFYYLARALGFDATAVVGRCSYLWNPNQAISHAWVEIPIGGVTYIFDPQIENYNLRSGISNVDYGAFQVTAETAHATYYPNR